MGNTSKQQKGDDSGDSDPKPGNSKPREAGPRLKLWFHGRNAPELDRAEFHSGGECKPRLWQQGHDEKEFRITWSKVPVALSLFFLDYVSAADPKDFRFSGPRRSNPAASLGDAISQPGNKLHRFLADKDTHGGEISRVDRIFYGKNVDGDKDDDRHIQVRTDYLPQDSVEIQWDYIGDRRLTPDEARELAGRLRHSLKLPEQARGFVGEADDWSAAVEIVDEPDPPLPKSSREQPPPSEPPEQRDEPTLSLDEDIETQGQEPEQTPLESSGPVSEPPPTDHAAPQANEAADEELFSFDPTQEPPPVEPKTADSPPPGSQKTGQPYDWEPKTAAPPPTGAAWDDAQTREYVFGGAREEAEKPDFERPDESVSATIDPKLFEIQNPEGLTWSDSQGLMNFGDPESDADVWTIRDSTESVAIFGGVGSGKTSSSGWLLSREYLVNGFGGLVLTAKPDEAARWVRLCEETGRGQDCIRVAPGSGHKLNFLQYETQRPGDRISVTDDLIGLFRCLLEAMGTSTKDNTDSNGGFWTRAVNELMRRLFDIFLISGEPLTMRRITRFVDLAVGNVGKPWQSIEFFSDVIRKAMNNARSGSETDRSVFFDAFDYWTAGFPGITPETQSGIVASFSSMASILTGRGIYDMVCTGTNLTPEMALSGKICILDFPLKGNREGGHMIQSAFKLLFQQAIERRADKGLESARPVFLWEDEAHLFFSHHDPEFQPTTRDCRASHVMISQNLHNYLHLGHDEHAVRSVFAAMNTYIFHANPDPHTNGFASEVIGDARRNHLTSDGLLKDTPYTDYSLYFKPPGELKSIGKLGVSTKQQRAIPPEDFAKLKRGGDGTSEAIVFWMSHRFAVNGGHNFHKAIFPQQPRRKK